MRAAFSNNRGSTCAGREAQPQVSMLATSQAGNGGRLYRVEGRVLSQNRGKGEGTTWEDLCHVVGLHSTSLYPELQTMQNAKFLEQGGFCRSRKVWRMWPMAAHRGQGRSPLSRP